MQSSMPGQGTRPHMPQLRVRTLQLKILHAATKNPICHNQDQAQPDKYINFKKLLKQKNKCIINRYVCLVAQLCPTLKPHGLQLPGSSVYGDSPGKNIGVGCQALLHRFVPTQGSNPGVPHCRQILYHLSHQGSANKQIDVLILRLSLSSDSWQTLSRHH